MKRWFDNGNKCISISFNKDKIKEGIKKTNTDKNPYINSMYEETYNILGIQITYTDFNFNKIIHVMIDEDDNYTASEDYKNIKVLKETCYEKIKNDDYHQTLPFNLNYGIKENGNKVLFITGLRDYFLNSGLASLATPVNEILERTKKYENYFPKYDINKTNIVIYKKMED